MAAPIGASGGVCVDAAIHDVIVDRDVVCDVGRVAHDIDRAVARRLPATEVAFAETIFFDEDPLRRRPAGTIFRSVPIGITIAAVIIAPVIGVDLDADQKIIRGRHREPADITAARAPHCPGRRPDITGQPNPPVERVVNPAAIMEGNVPPGIAGNPSYAELVSVLPVTVGIIGTEIRTDIGRPPNAAPARVIIPIAMRREFVFEIIIVDVVGILVAVILAAIILPII